MSQHPIDPIDPLVAALIRIKAAQISRSKCGPAVNRQDIAQDLIADLLARRRSYNPAHSDPDTFARMVVEHGAANIVRGQKAGKRIVPRLPGENPESCIDRRQEEADAERDMIADVREAIAALPAELRTIAGLLSQGTIAEVARELGVTRDTIYARVRSIRERFERKGLEIYLKKLSTVREATG